MTEQYVNNLRDMVRKNDLVEGNGGLTEPNNTARIPLMKRKAGRTAKKLARCRFCAPTKPAFTCSGLTRHTSETHKNAVRFLDNPSGAIGMFQLGISLAGKKGAYLQHRAFYNILHKFGVVDELPPWVEFADIKPESNVEHLAVGNPVVHKALLEESTHLQDPLTFEEPGHGLGLSLALSIKDPWDFEDVSPPLDDDVSMYNSHSELSPHLPSLQDLLENEENE